MKLRLTKARLLTSSLVLVNICTLSVLLDRAWHGTQTQFLLATAPKPFAIPELNTEGPAQAGSLTVIQDQPVFYASRHFYTPPPPSALPATPPKPDYRLVGTFIIPSKPTVALLTGAGGVSRKVKTGDDLDGWTVHAVEAGRVTLQYEATTLEISSASKSGNAGMQVVSAAQTAQTSQVAPAGSIRVLGAAAVQGAGAAASHSGYLIPDSSPRLYRPPPK